MKGKAVNNDPAQRDSFTELLGQLANSSASVVHDEIELVIQRLREKAGDVRSGVFILAAGAAVCFAAFMSLCAALIIGLAAYMPPVAAASVTGAALALIGIIIVFIGFRQLKAPNLKTPKAAQKRSTGNGRKIVSESHK